MNYLEVDEEICYGELIISLGGEKMLPVAELKGHEFSVIVVFGLQRSIEDILP